MKKYMSRKFILCALSCLCALATFLYGIITRGAASIIVGNVCMMLSAGIYAAMEAIVDAAAVEKDVEIVEEVEDDN